MQLYEQFLQVNLDPLVNFLLIFSFFVCIFCWSFVSSGAGCCVVRLFIEKLPKHPNYKNASKEDKQNTRKVM